MAHLAAKLDVLAKSRSTTAGETCWPNMLTTRLRSCTDRSALRELAPIWRLIRPAISPQPNRMPTLTTCHSGADDLQCVRSSVVLSVGGVSGLRERRRGTSARPILPAVDAAPATDSCRPYTGGGRCAA